jgi:hypothetical protein
MMHPGAYSVCISRGGRIILILGGVGSWVERIRRVGAYYRSYNMESQGSRRSKVEVGGDDDDQAEKIDGWEPLGAETF